MSIGITEIVLVAGVSIFGAALVAALALLAFSLVCRRHESKLKPPEE